MRNSVLILLVLLCTVAMLGTASYGSYMQARDERDQARAQLEEMRATARECSDRLKVEVEETRQYTECRMACLVYEADLDAKDSAYMHRCSPIKKGFTCTWQKLKLK